MQSLELLGVRLEQPGNSPVLLLRERDGQRRVLPIYIGGPEAASIAYALEGATPPRPLTHDLMRNIFTEVGLHLVRVVVTEYREHTYYAELYLEQQGSEHVISARPSDAVALAVRTGSPLFASEAVLDAAGQIVDESADESTEGEPEQILEEFREFIKDVNPEDFGA